MKTIIQLNSISKKVVERILILLSLIGLFILISPKLVYIGYTYMSGLILLYAIYLYISKTRLKIYWGTIIFIVLLCLIFSHGIYHQEFEYKKYRYAVLIMSFILLQFNSSIFTKHLKFTKKTFLIIILTLNLIFALKLIFSKDNFIYLIEYQFGNIGTYTIFLSLNTIIFLNYFKTPNIVYTKVIKIFLIVFITICIIILGSRTALIILATYCGLVLLKNSHYPKMKYFIGSGLLVLFITILAISVKNNSTQGRFFIWKTTTLIIKDNPLTGIGYNNFATVYPLYQASIYKQGEMLPKNILLADNTKVAINEYLHIATELGIIGLIIFLLLLSFYLYYAKKEDVYMYICLCITMVFSYILHSSIIAYLIILLLSLTVMPAKCKLNHKLSYFVLFVSILFAVYNIYTFHNKHIGYEMARNLWKQSPDKINGFYKNNERYLCDDTQLLFALAGFNYNHNNIDEALVLLSQLDKLLIRNDIELLKAKCYIKKKDYNLAEKHLLTSVAICPNRFINRYELFKFYINQEMEYQAIETAKGIYFLEEKVQSAHTITIKEDIMNYLNKKIIENRKK